MMIAKKMMTAKKDKLVYVGGKVFTAGSVGAAGLSIPLTDLSGGINSEPSEGDIVIVANAVSGQSAYTLTSYYPVDFTTLASVTATDANKTTLKLSYKIMAAIPDTSISIPTNADSYTGNAVIVQVWRGVDPLLPIRDLYGFYMAATHIDGAHPNPPVCEPITKGAVVAAFGAEGCAGMVGGVFSSGDLEKFISGLGEAASYIGVACAGGYKRCSEYDAVDPASFSFSGTGSADNASVSFSIVLNPA
ncbi:MAG TPA: hypothetical protein CFH81_08825 [Sulfurovum sp. UBA12169]|nr:MAG TPA: hypothetical protein CFH81_08825 [Sulfurovum sp. UBA12169]